MNRMIEKVTRFGAIKFNKGKLFLWNIDGILTPLSMNSYFWKLLEKRFGKKEAMNVLFAVGKEQGVHAYNIIAKKFGFKKSIRNKKELLRFIIEQSPLAGHGAFKEERFDLKNNILIVHGTSSMAQNYKKVFGIQKEPIDHFLRGQMASIASQLFNREVVCIEKSCVAMGHKECIFVVKPLEQWKKSDLEMQRVDKIPSIKELGSFEEHPF